MPCKRWFAALVMLVLPLASAQAGVRIGVGIGIGVPVYRPYYRPYYAPYYYPPPYGGVYYAPAPVYYAPSPVYYRVVPTYAPAPAPIAVQSDSALIAPTAPSTATPSPTLPPARVIERVPPPAPFPGPGN